MTELRFVWPVNMTGHGSKIILSPERTGITKTNLRFWPNND